MKSPRQMGWLVLAAAALVWLVPAPAAAQPRLAVRDLLFDHALRRVRMAQWQGRPVIFALSLAAEPTPRRPQPPYDLSLVRLAGGVLAVAGRWRLPRELRWVEPISLAAGRQGLWALIGTGWYLGRIEGDEIKWRLLCRCETLFSAGKGLLPFKARFAVDLNGDGQDEVLLPHWRGLMVYRIAGEEPVLEPLWRNRWEIGEHYDLRNDRMKITLDVPRYVLKDADGDGNLDFIIITRDGLRVAPQPEPLPPEHDAFYVPDKDKLPELRRLELPPSLLAALEGMKPASFGSAQEFRAALAKNGAGEEEWEPHMEVLLETIREAIPTHFARPVPIPGLSPPGKKERYKTLTVEDMNGDGVLDLVHMKSTDEGELLEQKNQLRWYEGRRGRRGLAFRKKPNIFFSEGPAFAKLVFPVTGGEGSPVLFLATTEVSLMAIIRAFTFNEVSLNLFVYPWVDGRLVTPPPVSGDLVFELKGGGKKNRPMLLLADLDGDGLREYLFNMETDTLSAFAGRREGPDFDGEPLLEIEVTLPMKPDTIFVGDLDNDGKEELLLWYLRYSADSALRRTLRVLQYTEAPPASRKQARRVGLRRARDS